jgi:uncharacterized membrane protein
MSTKVKADLPVYAELRELNSSIDAEEKKMFSDWLTPEFWTMAMTVLTNLLAVGVLLGWLSSADVETLTKAITGIVGAAEVILLNSLLVWKFINDRTAVRTETLRAKYQLMEAVAIERVRAQ